MIIKKRSDFFKKTPDKPTVKSVEPQKEEVKEEKIDLFDLDNIDFSQRQERRRGDRRRGYRRIDDRNLISRAQEEAGTIKDNAAKEGYRAGLEQAKDDILKIQEAIGCFMNAKEQVFDYIAPDILEIGVDIARKIVKKEIEQNPELVLESIKEVLKSLPKDESKIVVSVNPTQLELTRESIPEILTEIGIDVKTNVVGDDTIEIGSCIIKTSNGIVDASIETQLEIIKEAFKGM